MTPDIDRSLTAALDALGPQDMPLGFADLAVGRVHGVSQRRPRVRALDGRAWPARRWSVAHPATRRAVTIAVAALLVVAMIGVAVAAGRAWLQRPTFQNILTETGWVSGDLRGVTPVALSDGRLLVFGGQSWTAPPDQFATGASILDPGTRMFTPTGEMRAARRGAAPVLLRDGRVLVVGGLSDGSGAGTPADPAVGGSEVFDPRTGTFTPTGRMSTPRTELAVVRLDDGRVLVVGGRACPGPAPEPCPPDLSTAETWDPATGTFSPTGSMVALAGTVQAARLPGGHVLVVGGMPEAPTATETYDPHTGRFSPSAATVTAFATWRLVPRHDDPPLVIGEQEAFRVVLDEEGNPVHSMAAGGGVLRLPVSLPSIVERYDVERDRFEVIGRLPYPAQAAVERADGRIVVSGATDDPDGTTDVSWAGVFDPSTGETQLIAPPGRIRPQLAMLADGRVVFVAGESAIGDLGLPDALILE